MEAVQKMVDAYIGNGFNYFDTMPVYTFLDSHRFVGKKVIPFSTHGGSSLAGTVAKVAQAEPGADVEMPIRSPATMSSRRKTVCLG